ncbi:hypothetical protein P691DRAFT_13781 [Macrolepiota fuliginosa MF-IS2]|uniref:Uncharacterized protein n=1 Tax=Macrolepiota fuliginosa MF-IS2 TaxID=1400762 RepID=A0A9P6CBH0_9AGAR|nr:hypothetical protein P691DRAFT_13781 [Macrolepiota fuliginosa MF-IS2]
MKHLLGLNPSAPAITQYIDSLAKATNVAQIPDIKSYSDVVYINYYPLGISLLFTPQNNYKLRTGLKLSELQQDNLSLDSVDIYNVPKPKDEGGEKPKASRSELAFTTFPTSPIILPITARVKDKDGKAIERPPQLDITLETSGKDFVEALGEPDRKGGGTGPSSGSINIWCEWLNDGVMVEFGGAQAKGPHAWEMGKDAVWKVITFFQPGSKRE